MYDTRIFYQDTDAGGVVYYADYFKFFEKSWYEWLASIGIVLDEWEKRNIFVMVKEANADLLSAVRLGQTIHVRTTVQDVGRASFLLVHTIHCEERLTTRGRTQMVCVDGQGKLKGLPAEFRQALLNQLSKE